MTTNTQIELAQHAVLLFGVERRYARCRIRFAKASIDPARAAAPRGFAAREATLGLLNPLGVHVIRA